MARLEWGGEPHMFEMGLDRGVLYLDEGAVPWNGLVGVQETIESDTETTHYFDGIRAHVFTQNEDFGATIKAYTYPDIFSEYNGFGRREVYKRFNLSYRTEYGEDGYQIHLVYNALVDDTARGWNTLTDRMDPSLFSWDISAAAVPVAGARPTAHVVLDSADLSPVLTTVEDVLYGTDDTDPRMPTPGELLDIYESATTLRITYHADGTYTAEGPDNLLQVFPDGTFTINAPTAFSTDAGKLIVSSSK